jgi:hypothetical protein
MERSGWWRLLMVVMIALATMSCRGAPAYHVEGQAFATPSAPLDKRSDQIKRAGASAGWLMSDVQPGQVRGKLSVKSATVVVVVTFTNSTYSINYDPSTTKYDGETVRKQYNKYVMNLERAIYQQSQS